MPAPPDLPAAHNSLLPLSPVHDDTAIPFDDAGDGVTTHWSRIASLSGDDRDGAWKWFVDRYRPFVRGLIGVGVHSPRLRQAAEDDFWGYVYISRSVERADRDRKFRNFLSGVVRNFVKSWVRTHGPTDNSDTAARETMAPESFDDELRLWAENLLQIAMRELSAEHPRYATTLSLFYGLSSDGSPCAPMPASKVAEQLSCSPESVYMTLVRARERLRSLIERELRRGCEDEASLLEERNAMIRAMAKGHPGLVNP